MRTRWFAVLVVSLVLVAGTARAQEKGQTGITFGYPASIGILWHPAASFAVRPDFSFSSDSVDNSGTNITTGTFDNTNVGVGISALFYVHTWDKLRAYVAPRFGYSRQRTTSRTSSTSALTGTSEGTGNGYSVRGAVGVQYALSRRFGVYGETGIDYLRSTGEDNSTYTNPTAKTTSAITSSRTSRTWSTRAGLGVVVYF